MRALLKCIRAVNARVAQNASPANVIMATRNRRRQASATDKSHTYTQDVRSRAILDHHRSTIRPTDQRSVWYATHDFETACVLTGGAQVCVTTYRSYSTGRERGRMVEWLRCALDAACYNYVLILRRTLLMVGGLLTCSPPRHG